ncbi:MAG TPA: aromatic hydrocarbon degradation protein [Ferruginibacter sp.]|nr:aromatic hydrocarbon degradation protein [Ferruginibacter sp.]
MTKYIPVLLLLIPDIVTAQAPEDALRYSFYPQGGTARNMAIGGAMGSLGGDINATFVNPAGLGFYKTGEFVLTPGFFFNNNKATFRGDQAQNKKNSFGFGASGLILGSTHAYDKSRSSAISIALTQTASFNNRVQYSGLNNYSSFSEQFAEEFAKSGRTIDEVLNVNSRFPYTSAPALYTYLIDTVRVNGLVQVKGAPEYILDAGQALKQEKTHTTRGGISEFALGYAQNRSDKWYWGLSLGVPLVVYNSNLVFKESDTSSNSANHFKSFEYKDDFNTVGIGFNLKLGIIYRPQERIRLGLAIHTPTYMMLTETHTSELSTEVENPVNSYFVSSETFTNNQPGESKYAQLTPLKAMISASYVFREVENTKKQRAFITADIEYIHHKGSRFYNNAEGLSDEDKDYYKAYYKAMNQVVKREYKGAFNFRVGGELKFNVMMARLGFAYYGNPYKDAGYKANRMLLSGGLGYRNKGFFIDLTYVHAISKDVDFPYRLEDRANTYATLKQQRGNMVATLGFKF